METIAQDLAQMQRTPLADAHVARIRRLGRERSYAAGDLVVRPGDPIDEFLYVEEGEIELLDLHTGERRIPFTIGPTQYLGEIAFLSGGTWHMPMRAVVPTRAIAVPRRDMLDLMAQIPEMSDIIITVFAARRRRTLEAGDSGLTMIGSDADRDLRRIAAFLGRNRIPVNHHEAGSESASRILDRLGLPRDASVIVYGSDQVVEDRSPRAVARLLGLDLAFEAGETFDVVIVGGGPSGIAAAVYAGAEGLSALVVEDVSIGGQAGTSSRIENYMGFPTGISGADLCWRGEIQAMKFGARFAMPRRAKALARRDDGTYCVTLDGGEAVCARALVIATGVQYRRIGLDRIEHFEGAGIYYAATDLEARWCRGTEVVVVGGGNSAGQAAMFLSRAARHVHVLIRGSTLAASMSSYLSDRLEKDPAITLHRRTEITALHGEDALEAVTIRDREGGQNWRLATRAVFVMIGAAPNTDWLSGVVDLDAQGFVRTGEAVGATSPFATSAPGIFAVGDVRSGSVKRVASSVGEGSVVISRVWEHVSAMR
jgi:thioredoxin reductase (NADPH)